MTEPEQPSIGKRVRQLDRDRRIKNEELIELQKLALGNIKRELEQSKNIKDVSFEDGIDVIIP